MIGMMFQAAAAAVLHCSSHMFYMTGCSAELTLAGARAARQVLCIYRPCIEGLRKDGVRVQRHLVEAVAAMPPLASSLRARSCIMCVKNGV